MWLSNFLRPDGKSQVSVEYDGDSHPCGRYKGRDFNAAFNPEVSNEQIREEIIEQIVKPTIPTALIDEATKITSIRPAGLWSADRTAMRV